MLGEWRMFGPSGTPLSRAVAAMAGTPPTRQAGTGGYVSSQHMPPPPPTPLVIAYMIREGVGKNERYTLLLYLE